MTLIESLILFYVLISFIHMILVIYRDYLFKKYKEKDIRLSEDYKKSLVAIEALLKQNNELRSKLNEI